VHSQLLPARIDSVADHQREARRTQLSAYLAVLGVGLLIGIAGFGAIASPTALATAALLCVVAAILLRPVTGVYLTVFFSVIGDGSTMNSYPFNFNFSSPRSMLYLSDALPFSPLDLCLILTVVSWFLAAAGSRDWTLRTRPLLRPMLVFSALLAFGLLWGIGRGGSLTVAMWELRPLTYLVLMYVFATHLFTRSKQYVLLAWLIALAIAIQHVFVLQFYFGLSAAQREAMQALTEHQTSLLYTFVLILTLALWLFRRCSWTARLLLLILCVPTLWVFVLSERRAGFVALVVGFIVLGVVLAFRRTRVFFVVLPIGLIGLAGYTAAFWNAEDGIGFGAVAIKSVIAPTELSESDASSDLYRQIENFNLVQTAKSQPLGVGFGQPFLQLVPLPELSVFPFQEYIPHNSVMWIWLKTGYLGLVVLLYLIAAAIRAGIQSALRLPTGDALAFITAALAYIAMFVTFAFVDMAWTAQSCLVLAVCLAAVDNVLPLWKAETRAEVATGKLDEQSFDAFEQLMALPRR
jgi:hypothetical protein